MIASPELIRTAAVATCLWWGLPRMLAFGPECTHGLARIGISHTPQVALSCRSAAISALESRSNSGCIDRRKDEPETCAITFIGHGPRARLAGTDKAPRNASRGYDLKFLSIRGEATPRTPVWRSKSGSELERWNG